MSGLANYQAAAVLKSVEEALVVKSKFLVRNLSSIFLLKGGNLLATVVAILSKNGGPLALWSLRILFAG